MNIGNIRNITNTRNIRNLGNTRNIWNIRHTKNMGNIRNIRNTRNIGILGIFGRNISDITHIRKVVFSGRVLENICFAFGKHAFLNAFTLRLERFGWSAAFAYSWGSCTCSRSPSNFKVVKPGKATTCVLGQQFCNLCLSKNLSDILDFRKTKIRATKLVGIARKQNTEQLT